MERVSIRSVPDRIPPGPIKLTYSEYVELPDDGKRYEVLDGELFVTPAPRPKHQAISRNLQYILHTHIKEGRLGQLYNAPIDLILAETTIAQPDLLFVAGEHESMITERAIEGPPELVVEILSPSTARSDRIVKAALYARFGIPHYWILDPPERTLEMYAVAGNRYELATRYEGNREARTPLFPGLVILLAEVWE